MKNNKYYENRINKFLQYIISESDFYKNKLMKNISNCSSQSDNFFSLPFTTKEELLHDQEINPPFGSNITIQPSEIQRIHKTSGTTCNPLIILFTKKDIEKTVKIGARCFENSGLTSTDLVIHCLNYNLWTGGYTDHQSLETTGAGVIPFGVGNSQKLIETILLLKPTAIHCTPSYLLKIEEILSESFKLYPKDLNLKIGLFGAESGLQNPKFRSNIEFNWGIKAMNANYGMSEVLSIFASECHLQCGLHFLGEDLLFVEMIDQRTYEKIDITNGAVGELVLTTLYKQAQPLLRYRTGDIIKILNTNCICGGKGFVFEIIGRADEMLVVKGLNFFPNRIEMILEKFADEINNHYQILVSKNDPITQIIIRIELRKDSAMEISNLRDKLQKEFKLNLDINPILEIMNESTLPRTSGKSKTVLRIL